MTKAKALPSQEYLQECFHYEPTTGKLFWKDRPREHFNSSRGYKNFKLQFAGKEVTSKSRNGYVYPCVDGRLVYAHRVIWKMVHGECPEYQIDHINGIRDDNRLENLRVVSNQENQRNAKRRKDNTSKVVGVSWHNRDEVWCANIKVDGKQINLGNFTDKIDAIYARYYAEQDYGYHENHGRQ